MNTPKTNIKKQQNVQSVGIKSITLDGVADVYNMEVEDNHNFAINGGLIVHNCCDSGRYFAHTVLRREFYWLDWGEKD